LKYFERDVILKWLNPYPELRELYQYKEAMHRFYRIKGYGKARRVLYKMLDQMAKSKQKVIQTLRRTLKKWSEEILNYFKTGITNARTEGFNNVAKLIQKRSYGVKNFEFY